MYTSGVRPCVHTLNHALKACGQACGQACARAVARVRLFNYLFFMEKMMTTESQAAFARRLGVDRSHVTRLKQHGRLVMGEGGGVDVQASLRRIIETAGGRDDVAARWAGARLAETAQEPSAASPRGQGMGEAAIGETRADAQARKEAAAADLLEIELAQKRGNLIPKEDVDTALKTFAAAMRAGLEVLADQVAPLVAPVSNLDEVHAVLAEAARGIQASVADQLARAEAALRAEGG